MILGLLLSDLGLIKGLLGQLFGLGGVARSLGLLGLLHDLAGVAPQVLHLFGDFHFFFSAGSQLIVSRAAFTTDQAAGKYCDGAGNNNFFYWNLLLQSTYVLSARRKTLKH